MTNNQWAEVLKVLYGCWPRMDQTEVIAQAWRLAFDKYKSSLVIKSILKFYVTSDERFGPMPNDIMKVVKAMNREEDLRKRIEIARNTETKPVKCIPAEMDKMKINARLAPECQAIQQPSKEQISEAIRIKNALINEGKEST